MTRFITTFLAALMMGGVAQPGEWGGGYFGVSLGTVDTHAAGGGDGADTSYALHLGYDHDLGDVLVGAEAEYDPSNIVLGGGKTLVERTERIKLRTGYDFGTALGYLVMGGARLETSSGSDTGVLFGAGVAVDLGNGFTLSGEGLHHDFNNFKGLGADLNMNSLALRASFRF